MKVLFVNAVDPASEVENRFKPLWPAYLAAYCNGFLAKGQVEFRFLSGKLEEQLQTYGPDVVAIGGVTQNFHHAVRCAAESKTRGAVVIVGGPHISALPSCLSNHMDVGCIGEGEQTFLELMQIVLKHGGLPVDALRGVRGIVFRAGDRLSKTPARPLLEKIDAIPHPDRSLVKAFQPHSYMFTSRGCPYKCVFCASSRFWQKVRFASAEYILEEIELLAEKGARTISFYDDLFAVNKQRLERLADLLSSTGVNRNLRFTCSLRANVVTRDLVELLKRINIVSVGMGLESGSDRTLSFLKGNVTVADNDKAVRLLKEAGIQVNASFVIGSPDETGAEVMDTFRFIRHSSLDFVDTYVLTPLPGTPIWTLAAKRGLVSDDMDWSRLNVNFEYSWRKAVIVSERLSREDIRRLYMRFRRQRVYRILKALPRSPWLSDVPRVAFGIILEKALRLGRKLWGTDE